MSSVSTEERIVRPFTPLPPGYIFVPKGNIYITKNCRKLTQAQNKPVYTVQSDKRTTLGIRVPNSVYSKVLAENKATAAARAENVRRKDQNLEDKTEAEILSRFPRIPKEHVARILKHTLQKRSRRVGRSKETPLSQVVDLAVRAYIRHKLTDYDAMLRKGIGREQARRMIQELVDEKVLEWGGTVRSAKTQRNDKKGSKRALGKNSKPVALRDMDPKLRELMRTPGRGYYVSPPCRLSPAGVKKSRRTATSATLRPTRRPPSEAQGRTFTFRPRQTSLRNKDGQTSLDEKIVIVISDDDYDEDFVDVDSIDAEDSDASYQDESDFGV